MARTLPDIYNAIVAEKQSMTELQNLQPNIDNAQTLLADLTSPSRVANWRLWIFIMAVAIWVHENLWDNFKAEITQIVNLQEMGTTRWYQQKCFEFQLGYSLIWLNNKFQYSTNDDAAKIVNRAAVIETGGQVIVKVAKLSGTDVVPLNVTELSAFNQYMKQIRFAGTNLIVISRTADLLHLNYDIYYDPLVLKADGSLLSDPSTFPVEVAINNYISNLPFNGALVIESLEDAIQAAAGVLKLKKNTLEAKYGALPYAAIDVEYQSDAGYLSIDPAYPLNTSINYIANV